MKLTVSCCSLGVLVILLGYNLTISLASALAKSTITFVNTIAQSPRWSACFHTCHPTAASAGHPEIPTANKETQGLEAKSHTEAPDPFWGGETLSEISQCPLHRGLTIKSKVLGFLDWCTKYPAHYGGVGKWSHNVILKKHPLILYTTIWEP